MGTSSDIETKERMIILFDKHILQKGFLFSTFTQSLFYVMENNEIASWLDDSDLWPTHSGQNGNGFCSF
jgi:hypothetical protein